MNSADTLEVIEPDARLSGEARHARQAIADALQRALASSDAETVRIDRVDLSRTLAEIILAIVSRLSEGQGLAVHIIGSREEEVSTSQAARMLGMSRPTLINLLETGAIPYRKVGTHRRVPVQDLVTYKTQMQHGPSPARAEKLQALEEMADYTDGLGLGY